MATPSLAFPFIFTKTPLAANGVYTSPVTDIGLPTNINVIRLLASSDQTGLLTVQQSYDGSTNWHTTRPSDIGTNGASSSDGVTVGANFGSSALSEVKMIARYFRVVYYNGATAQGSFEVIGSMIGL